MSGGSSANGIRVGAASAVGLVVLRLLRPSRRPAQRGQSSFGSTAAGPGVLGGRLAVAYMLNLYSVVSAVSEKDEGGSSAGPLTYSSIVHPGGHHAAGGSHPGSAQGWHSSVHGSLHGSAHVSGHGSAVHVSGHGDVQVSGHGSHLSSHGVGEQCWSRQQYASNGQGEAGRVGGFEDEPWSRSQQTKECWPRPRPGGAFMARSCRGSYGGSVDEVSGAGRKRWEGEKRRGVGVGVGFGLEPALER